MDIVTVCEHIDMMLLYKRADLIKESGANKLVKLDFAIEGTRLSPKASGNRCILLINEGEKTVRILLAYSKDDVISKQETAWWQQAIKMNFSGVRDIFNL